MPTILTHSCVALALGPTFRQLKIPTSALWVGALCCIVPDADVVAFLFDIPYASTFGHRGFTHSFFFAALLSGLITGWYRLKRGPELRLWPLALFLFLCTASHPLLDALTNGGEGVALFSPFSNTRYFAPWRPINVSPLLLSRFLEGSANHVLRSEGVWIIAPCLVIALGSLVFWRWRAARQA